MQEMLGALPPALAAQIERRASDELSGLAGVLHAGADDAALRHRLAAADGALLPLYQMSGEPPRYPLYRMLAERVLSINTAAAGGNTTLMTLGA